MITIYYCNYRYISIYQFFYTLALQRGFLENHHNTPINLNGITLPEFSLVEGFG